MHIGSESTKFTFPARDRLKLRKKIETLFLTGEAFSIYPFRIVFLTESRSDSSAPPTQMGVTVPKKKRKFAHDRNQVKRYCREAWRLQRAPLQQSIPENLQLQVFFIFVGKTMPTFAEVNVAIQKGIVLLQSKIAMIPTSTSSQEV